jgi:hypothetical protein
MENVVRSFLRVEPRWSWSGFLVAAAMVPACGSAGASADAGPRPDSSAPDARAVDSGEEGGHGDDSGAGSDSGQARDSSHANDGGHESDGGHTSLDYPLLGTYNLGGDQALYAGAAWQTWAGKFHVNIVSDYIGLEQSMGETMSDVFSSIKTHGAANGIAPKCLIYTIDEDMPFTRGASASNNSTFLKLWDAVDANDWWLRTTWPSGSIVQNGFSSSLAQVNNGIHTTTDSSGRTATQFFSWYWNQIFILGNASSLGESAPIAPNPNCDGIFRDNQFWTPRVSGDWLENGTTQTASDVGGSGNPTLNPVIQQGHAQAIAAERSYNPALMNMGNCDWFSDSSSTIDPSCRGLYDAQLLEAAMGESYSVEEYAGFDQLMTNMIAAEALLAPGGFSLMGQYNASGTNAWPQSQSSWNASHYRAMRYGLCTALQRGYYYGAESGNPATLWYFDEYDGGTMAKVGYLGPPVDPPQSASWQNGVWRRRYQNGTAYVNPKGNGMQTVNLGVTQYHMRGSQQPTVNTGASATSVTLQDRDGIVMLNNAPP